MSQKKYKKTETSLQMATTREITALYIIFLTIPPGVGEKVQPGFAIAFVSIRPLPDIIGSQIVSFRGHQAELGLSVSCKQFGNWTINPNLICWNVVGVTLFVKNGSGWTSSVLSFYKELVIKLSVLLYKRADTETHYLPHFFDNMTTNFIGCL